MDLKLLLFYKMFRSTNNVSLLNDRYVPQIRTPWLPHPLLATNITLMDPEHIAWTGEHESYNICSVSVSKLVFYLSR